MKQQKKKSFHIKHPLFFSDFNETLTFSIHPPKLPEHQI